MKRILLIVLVLTLGVSVFAGCGNEPENRTFETKEAAAVNSIFPEEPPTLTVSDGTTSIQAWRGTYSWMVEDANGMGKAVNADSSHPLERTDDMEALTLTDDTTLILTFETSPTSMTVKRYKLNAKDYDAFDKVADGNNMIEAEVGDYLYEVIAKWENPHKQYSGTVHFAFITKK